MNYTNDIAYILFNQEYKSTLNNYIKQEFCFYFRVNSKFLYNLLILKYLIRKQKHIFFHRLNITQKKYK